MNKVLKVGRAAVACVRQHKGKIAATLAVVASNAAFAVGTADADISTTVDNNTATWLLVKGSIIAIGGFLVGYGFFKRIRRA